MDKNNEQIFDFSSTRQLKRAALFLKVTFRTTILTAWTSLSTNLIFIRNAESIALLVKLMLQLQVQTKIYKWENHTKSQVLKISHLTDTLVTVRNAMTLALLLMFREWRALWSKLILIRARLSSNPLFKLKLRILVLMLSQKTVLLMKVTTNSFALSTVAQIKFKNRISMLR